MKNKLLILLFVFFQYGFSEECVMSGVPPFLKKDINSVNTGKINCSEKQRIGSEQSLYYRDNSGVYLNATNSSLNGGWVYLEMLNPDETVYVDTDYVKDNKYVYNYARLIENADAETFTVLNQYYSKDKNRVFYRGNELQDLDPAVLEILNFSYAKDKNLVYYEKIKLKNADAKTFEVLKDGVYGRDKKYIYYRENLVEKADYKSFEVLNFKYAKDKNFVYGYGKKLAGADVKTFKLYSGSDPEFKNIGEYYDSADKNNYYLNGDIIKKK